MRPSLPAIFVVTVPSPFCSMIAGPASGVDSVLPVKSFVALCVKLGRWIVVRVTFPLWSKYVVVRRRPSLWIVSGNEHAVPAAKWNVLLTAASATVGGTAPAVVAVAAAASVTAASASSFFIVNPPFDRFPSHASTQAGV